MHLLLSLRLRHLPFSLELTLHSPSLHEMENKNSPVARLDDEQSIELQFSFPKSISNFLPASPSIPKYQRISPGDVDTQCDGAQSPDNSNEGDLSQLSSIGLGIGNVTGRGTPSAQKVPAGSKPIEGTPTSNDFLLSPTSTQIGSGDSPEYDKKFDHRRNISGASSIDQRSTEGSEIEHLTSRHDGGLGKGSFYQASPPETGRSPALQVPGARYRKSLNNPTNT